MVQYHRLFKDAISVTIPLNVTADMGVAMKRTRAKRIRKLKEAFPILAEQDKNDKEENDNEQSNEDEQNDSDASSNKKEEQQPQIKSKSKHMPQRHEYASMLDYLEAKYAQGVMIDSDNDDASSQDGGGGSVYSSEESFLDDSLLKRDVAGQVMSQSIHTKQDDDFFVNVGNLEVEDEQNLMNYDPLADDAAVKLKKKKKRKPSTTSNTAENAPPPKKKKVVTPKPKKEEVVKKDDGPKQLTEKEQELLTEFKESAARLQFKVDEFHQQVVDAIHAMKPEDLPRKRTNKTKISITAPKGTSPGDTVIIHNPKKPDQRLKLKLPKNATPGKSFTVTIEDPNYDSDDEDDVDENKFSREFRDLLDDYSTAHDDWSQAKVRVHQLDGEPFQPHAARMNKFDSLIKEFPKNLKTPLDGAAMRQLVRRARQNRHKRKKTLAKLHEQQTTLLVPTEGTMFQSFEFDEEDFE